MEKLTMCRICLVEDVSMYEVANKDLQEMYEKLTDIPFVTEDCRPMLACFFCYTKLKQCRLFQRKCLKAEEVFAEMLNGGYKQIPLESQGEIVFCGGFIKTPIEHMSIDDVCQTESGAIRDQIPAVCDVKDDILIELKQEYLINEVKVEYEEDSYQDQEDIPSHHSESDSEDDVPLTKFKTEVVEEQGVPEENTRAPVANKTNLHIWKTKLEDITTHKPKKKGLLDSEIDYSTRNRTSKSVIKFREPISSDTIKDEFTCKICNYKSINRDDLNGHKSLCTKEKPFIDVCQRSSNEQAISKKHVRTHTGEKPYKCDICPKSFNCKSHLDCHIRIHTGEKPYKCNMCQRSFFRKGDLNAHIRIHTGEQPYKCNICQRRFTTKSNLNAHILIHTSEKCFKCDICQRSFSLKRNLKRHILIHTGEKPYQCHVCRRSFNQIDTLKQHIRIHTGEKPYKCVICQRSFNDKRTLKGHITIHTGEKPYKCDICHRGFTKKSNLIKHKTTH